MPRLLQTEFRLLVQKFQWLLNLLRALQQWMWLLHREVRVVRGGDVIVGIVGRGGLQVLVRSHLEVVGGLAVVIGGVVVEFVFALGNHVPGFLPVCEPPHGLSWALA